MENEFYTINEISNIFKISHSTIYKKLKNGEITGFKFGRCWKIPKTTFIQELYQNP